MPPVDQPTELYLVHPKQLLGLVHLETAPQPGTFLTHAGATYAVLERRHRYQLRSGRYQLHKIALYLQAVPQQAESEFIPQAWSIGDRSCRFNAQSPLLRCAVNPCGPCQGCADYQPLNSHDSQAANHS